MKPGFSSTLALTTLLLSCLIQPARSADAVALQARYNVLFIASDDLRCDLACYGHPQVKTPNLDRLAARGRLFLGAYCQQSLCNPSRTSLLTGLRPDRTGIVDNATHFRERLPHIVTLPQLFKLNGYETRGLGKLYHNYGTRIQGDPPSWNIPQRFHWGLHHTDWVSPNQTDPGPIPRGSATQCLNVADQAYWDGRIAAAAVEALRELKDHPFFLGVGFWKPHLPYNAPKKYWGLYDRQTLAGPAPAARPDDAPPVAFKSWNEIRSYTNVPNKGPIPTNTVTELRHGYLAGISFMDAQVGKVLDELDRLGLTEKTIVVFWGDNGFHLGEQDTWGKDSCFEFGARVPLIIALPGQTRPGTPSRALAELVDLYPTLADLCGLQPLHRLEGVSLRPLLEDPAATVKPAAFTQNPRPTAAKPQTTGYSVRTDRYRYTEWRTIASSNIVARELYDLAAHPAEIVNLAADPRHADELRRHADLLQSVAPSGTPDTHPNLLR